MSMMIVIILIYFLIGVAIAGFVFYCASLKQKSEPTLELALMKVTRIAVPLFLIMVITWPEVLIRLIRQTWQMRQEFTNMFKD